jgi:hypothetical protein
MASRHPPHGLLYAEVLAAVRVSALFAALGRRLALALRSRLVLACRPVVRVGRRPARVRRRTIVVIRRCRTIVVVRGGRVIVIRRRPAIVVICGGRRTAVDRRAAIVVVRRATVVPIRFPAVVAVVRSGSIPARIRRVRCLYVVGPCSRRAVKPSLVAVVHYGHAARHPWAATISEVRVRAPA